MTTAYTNQKYIEVKISNTIITVKHPKHPSHFFHFELTLEIILPLSGKFLACDRGITRHDLHIHTNIQKFPWSHHFPNSKSLPDMPDFLSHTLVIL